MRYRLILGFLILLLPAIDMAHTNAAEITCVARHHRDNDASSKEKLTALADFVAKNKAMKRQREWAKYIHAFVEATDSGASCRALSLQGKIVDGDQNKFDALLTSNPLVEIVYLSSSGGDLAVAIAIGTEIRKRLIETNAPWGYKDGDVWRTSFGPTSETGSGDCDPVEPCVCASTCFVAWAGGIKRSGDMLGLHRPSFEETWFGSLTPAEGSRKFRDLLFATERYLTKMEVERSLIDKMIDTPKEDLFLVAENKQAWDSLRGYTTSIKEWVNANCETLKADEEMNLRKHEYVVYAQSKPSPYSEGYVTYLKGKQSEAERCIEAHLAAARIDAAGLLKE